MIQFTDKLSRQDIAAIAPLVNQSVRNALSACEAILCSDTAAVFVGRSESSPVHLFEAIASDMRPADKLSVIELAEGLATSIPALIGLWRATAPAKQLRPSPLR